MESVTKATVTTNQIRDMVKQQFQIGYKTLKELKDGCYNTSFLVQLEDGREVVLKIAPPKDVEVLTYEQDIMASEVMFYQLANKYTDMPIPKVYDYHDSNEIIPQAYYFMSKLEGIPLNHVQPITQDLRRSLYENLAQNLGKLHHIQGKYFGYRTMEAQCRDLDCLGALMVSVEAVYQDGLRKNTGLPIDMALIRSLLLSAQPAFDEIEVPCLTHFDLWDGNIFVTQEPIRISGYIDFERGFYADPAADFCQAMGYVDLSQSQWFFDVYNEYAPKPLHYTNPLLVRMLSYRLYLFMIMHVECFYRDVEGSFEPQKNWVQEEIHKVFKALKEAVDQFSFG